MDRDAEALRSGYLREEDLGVGSMLLERSDERRQRVALGPGCRRESDFDEINLSQVLLGGEDRVHGPAREGGILQG